MPQRLSGRGTDGLFGGRAAWPAILIALGFLLGSWLMELHALEHLDEPGDADCEVCQLAGGLDDFLAPFVDGPAHETPRIATVPAWAPELRPHSFAAYRGRAPPLSRSS